MKTPLLRPLASLFLLLATGLHGEITPPERPPHGPPEGLAKSDWSSIRAAYEAGRHAFQAVDGGFQARNPCHPRRCE